MRQSNEWFSIFWEDLLIIFSRISGFRMGWPIQEDDFEWSETWYVAYRLAKPRKENFWSWADHPEKWE